MTRHEFAIAEGAKAIDDVNASSAAVLVVDDSRTSRLITEMCLRSAGFNNLRSVDSAAAALAAVGAWTPELIVTDIVMPEMDGFELCRRLRRLPELADVPIIAVTGLGKEDGRAGVFACGATDLVSKPINAPELISRARMHIEHRRLLARLTDYRESMARELDVARSMQISLMPDQALLDRVRAAYHLDIASLYRPSDELGGDLWGLDLLGPNRIRMYSADFSGHGVVSAFNTFRLHSVLQSGSLGDLGPVEWLKEVNSFLHKVLPVGQYATMFCADINLEQATLTCASAAAPVQFVSTGADFAPIELAGLPLGIVSQVSYDSVVLPFPPGSTLFFSSDALIETPDPCNPVINCEDIQVMLSALPKSLPMNAIIDRVEKALTEAAGDSIGDDLTIVAIRHVERSE